MSRIAERSKTDESPATYGQIYVQVFQPTSIETQLAIVIPLWNEIEIIEQLHQRVADVCQTIGECCEIIYVDDGSRDGTADWIQEFGPRGLGPNTKLRLLRLSRNFGQPSAISAGLRHAQAHAVVVMDGDLQDPPELILEMYEHWCSNSQVVIARRKRRGERGLRRIAFLAFHKLFGYLSDSAIPSNTGTFCLLDRRAADQIKELPESNRFFPGLRAWVGFRQTMIHFDRPDRAGGEPKQSFSRLFRYAMDAIFGYSLKPLRLVTTAGIIICAASCLLASWFVCKRLMGYEEASIGFTTLACAVFGLGGFQLVGMGILGEYIGRIYDEVKQRPQFIVADEFTAQSADDSQPQRNDARQNRQDDEQRRAG